MHIAINTHVVQERLHGMGQYVTNLVESLSAIDCVNRYTLYVSPDNVCHFEGLGGNFQLVLGPSGRSRRVLWEQTELPMDLARRKVDVFHGPGFVVPLLGSCKRVVTIADMTFTLFPEKHTFAKRHYFNLMIPLSVRASKLIIALSESTRMDLLRLLGLPPERVRAIHLAAGSRFRPVKDPTLLSAVRAKYGLKKKIILSLGMIEPRKNLERLIQAFARLKDLRGEYCLVVAGSPGWDYHGLFRAVESYNLEEDVVFLGYISDADLPALYSLAEVFVYPSLYEGFGIPVVEAMACGTPVITSRVSSLPEVVGNAAVLVDPLSVGGLANALQQVLANVEIRQQLKDKGLQRSRFFTWQKTARETLQAYKGVFG